MSETIACHLLSGATLHLPRPDKKADLIYSLEGASGDKDCGWCVLSNDVVAACAVHKYVPDETLAIPDGRISAVKHQYWYCPCRLSWLEASKHNGQSFFPIDGQMLGNEGNSHNYHFTYEIHSKFTYTDPASRDTDMVFNFSGDDDVWVYINDALVVDIGGVHGEKHGSVNVDSVASDIGLTPGGTYDFDFFFAERHLTESNFTVETTIQFLSPLYD